MEILAALDGDLLSLLIFAVISGLSALSNWLQKRNAQQEEFLPPPTAPVRRPPVPAPGSTPRQPGRPTPSVAPAPAPTPASVDSPRQVLTDWEAELRRLLGETTAPPAAEPAPPPSPTPPPLPQPSARQVQAPPPAHVEGASTSRSSESSFVPGLGRVAWDRVDEGASVEGAEAPTRPLATLSQSARGYGAASRLHETVALRMQEVSRQRTERSVKLTEVTRRDRPHSDAASMFLNPKSLRQAMIASIILGPPRSLE